MENHPTGQAAIWIGDRWMYVHTLPVFTAWPVPRNRSDAWAVVGFGLGMFASVAIWGVLQWLT